MNARGAGSCKSGGENGVWVTVNGHRVLQTHKFETGETRKEKREKRKEKREKNVREDDREDAEIKGRSGRT